MLKDTSLIHEKLNDWRSSWNKIQVKVLRDEMLVIPEETIRLFMEEVHSHHVRLTSLLSGEETLHLLIGNPLDVDVRDDVILFSSVEFLSVQRETYDTNEYKVWNNVEYDNVNVLLTSQNN